MRALRFVFLMAMSLIHIVPFAIIAALLAEHFIAHPKVHPAFDGYPHVGTVVFSCLVSIFACAIVFLSSDEASENPPMGGIFLRTAHIAVSWPLLRLAFLQPSWLAGLPFVLLAVLMLVSGFVGLLGTITQSRYSGLIFFGSAAFVILAFSFYLRGEHRWNSSELVIRLTPLSR